MKMGGITFRSHPNSTKCLWERYYILSIYPGFRSRGVGRTQGEVIRSRSQPITARRSGGALWVSQRCLGRSPSRQRFWSILDLKGSIWCYINHYFLKTVILFKNKKCMIIANEIIVVFWLFPVRSETQPGNHKNFFKLTNFIYPFYFVVEFKQTANGMMQPVSPSCDAMAIILSLWQESGGPESVWDSVDTQL